VCVCVHNSFTFVCILAHLNWYFGGQVLELCVGLCQVSDVRADVCHLITELPVDDANHTSLLTSIVRWAVLSPTDLVVAVECLQQICEVCVFP